MILTILTILNDKISTLAKTWEAQDQKKVNKQAAIKFEISFVFLADARVFV